MIKSAKNPGLLCPFLCPLFIIIMVYIAKESRSAISFFPHNVILLAILFLFDTRIADSSLMEVTYHAKFTPLLQL